MDTCLAMQKLISLQLDDALSPAQAEALDRHLTDCRGCRKFHDAMVEEHAQMNALSKHMHEGVQRAKDKALARIASLPLEPPDRVPWSRTLIKVAAVVAISAGCLVGWFVIEGQKEHRQRAVALKQVEALVASDDLRGLEAWLSSEDDAVWEYLLDHLATLGDAVTMHKLRELEQSATGDRQQALRHAITRIQGRLSGNPVQEPNEPNMPVLNQERPDDNTPEPNTAAVESLHSTVTLSGFVKDGAGMAIEGAQVSIQLHKNDQDKQDRLAPAVCFTDASGYWAIAGFPAEAQKARIRLEHAAFLAKGTVQVDKHREALELGTCVLTMHTAYTISGVVRDTESEPIADANVYGGWERGKGVPQTRTDAQGFFVLEKFIAGQVVLTVMTEAYAPQFKILEVPRDTEFVSFTMDRGQTIKAQVVDPTGRPIGGAKLEGEYQPSVPYRGPMMRMLYLGPRSLVQYSAMTDTQGWITLSHVPPTEIPFTVSCDGYVPIDRYPMQPSEEHYVIALQQQGQIRGRILDGRTGQPLSDYTLILGIQRAESDRVSWRRWEVLNQANGFQATDKPYDKTGAVVKATPGRYELTFTEEGQGLAVLVEAPGYHVVDTGVFFNQGIDKTHDIRLTANADVNGIVLAPNGLPVPQAMVAVKDRWSNPYISAGQIKADSSNYRLVQADQHGRFTLPARGASYALIALADAGVAEITQAEFEYKRVIPLQPWAQVSGQYREGDKPIPNVKVRLSLSSATDPNLHMRYGYSVRTDTNGRFTIKRVKPGNGGIASLITGTQGLHSTSHNVYFRLDPGQTLDVTLGGGGRRLTGRFFLPASLNHLGFEHGCFSLIPISRPIDTRSHLAPLPENFLSMSAHARQTLFHDPGDGSSIRGIRHYPALHKVDGSFVVGDVPVGPARFVGLFRDADTVAGGDYHNSRLASVAVDTVIPSGALDETVDLGDLQLRQTPLVAEGNPMPPLAIHTAGPADIQLNNYRGRTILLDLGFLSYRPEYRDKKLAVLKELYERHNEDLIIISIDASWGFPAQHVAQVSEPLINQLAINWPWGILETQFGRPPEVFYNGTGYWIFPGFIIIDAEGVVRDLVSQLNSLPKAVEQALKAYSTHRKK